MTRPMYSKTFCLVCFLALIAAGCSDTGGSGESIAGAKFSPVVGRWDVSVEDPGGAYPSWFEIQEEGGELSGRFVGRFGSARPIADIRFDGEQLRFTLPPQYERQTDDLLFIGRVTDQEIVVVEVDRPNRQKRRKVRKSNPTDAVSAARAALSGEASVTPKTRNGPVEEIRVLMVARRSARQQRIQSLNQLRHPVFTAPEEIRIRVQEPV